MTFTPNGYRIRPLRAQDMASVYEICLQTADSGADATALYSEPKLPGFIWAAPYGALEPDFSFILADETDRAVGYVVGAPDTHAFHDRLERDWWPDVRRQTATLEPKTALDRNALRLIGTPEAAPAWLLGDYPAHLHINILPGAQASGWGRRLIETELEALRAHGVAGVHLGVGPRNERAKGFYRHVGFADLSRDDKVLFGMKLAR